MKRWFPSGFLLVLLGCGVRGFYPHCNITIPPKASYSEVEVLSAKPSREYIALGEFAFKGWSWQNHQQVIQKARKQAVKLGADFIWVTKTDNEYHTSTTPTYGSPLAQLYGLNANSAYGGQNTGTIALPTINAIAGVYTPSKLGIHFDESALAGNPNLFIITGFDINSKAQEAGLKVGDQVLGIGGFDVSDKMNISNYSLNLQAGQKCKVAALRDGKIIDYEVVRVVNRFSALSTEQAQQSSVDPGNASEKEESALSSETDDTTIIEQLLPPSSSSPNSRSVAECNATKQVPDGEKTPAEYTDTGE